MTWLAYSHLGVAKAVQLTTQPAVAQAGIPFGVQPVGRLVDGSGVLSRATGVTVTASKASGSGSGVLSGTLTAQTVEGVFTFTDLKMDVIEATVVLQFASSGLTSAASNSFNVTTPNTIIGAQSGSYALTGTDATMARTRVGSCTPGVYAVTGTDVTLTYYAQQSTQLVITTQPNGAVSGVAFTTQPVVQLRNVSGANVAEAGVTVTAYLSSGSGTLSGTLTATTAATGAATFTNLTYTGTGNFTVSFHCLHSTVQTIWSDDVEVDRSSSYFEVDTAGGAFGRASVGGSMRWRSVMVAGAQSEWGNLKLGIGRVPAGSGITSVGPVGVDFGKVTMQFDMYHSTNSLLDDQDKLTRMIVTADSAQSEAAKSHCWSNGTTHLQLDPTSTVVNNVVTGVGPNDYAHQTYLGAVDGTTVVFGGAAAPATTLRTYRHEMTLNTPGQADGSNRLYINGALDIVRTGLDYVGTWTGYGINVCRWENYRELGIGKSNNRMYDNLLVTGQARSVVAADQLSASPGTPAATLSGTATSGWTETDVVAGGDTIVITLSDDTWVASGATFNAQRQAILNGIDSAQAEAAGWDAVRSGLPVTNVVRTSNTVVTITLSALASYVITANETLTVTVPAAAVTAAGALVATPSLTIANSSGVTPWLEEDFSTYANNTEIQASDWYNGAWQDTNWQATTATDGVCLDLTEGYGTSDRCLRTTTLIGAYDTEGRTVNMWLPSSTSDYWSEFWCKFSTTFSSNGTNANNPDYKFIFWSVQPNDGRNEIKVGNGGPMDELACVAHQWDDTQFITAANNLNSGIWHRYRAHNKVTGGSGAIFSIEFWDGTNAPILLEQTPTIAKTSMNYMVLGANRNKVATADMWLKWGKITLYNQDPGWGF